MAQKKTTIMYNLFIEPVRKFSALNLIIFLLCVRCTNPAKMVEVHEDGIPVIEIMANISNDYQMAERILSGQKGQILLSGNHQYLFYNLDGTLSHKTSVNKFEPCDWRSIVAYEDLYVGYVINKRGNATIRIAFFNKTGELIDSILWSSLAS